MKLLFPLILLLNVLLVKGEQGMKTYQPIVLRFNFAPAYKASVKYCCKLSRECNKLLDSTGFTSESLKGRVEIKRDSGWIEFRILDVQPGDAGMYRCLVARFEPQTYRDYRVELSEVAPTFKPRTASATLPQSTAAAKDEDLSGDRSAPWSSGLLLAVVVSVAAMLLITPIIAVVCCRFKAQKLDKCSEMPHKSLQQEAAQETSGPVYTTVEFRALQEQAAVHGNPRAHRTHAGDPKGNCSREHDGTAEYSVLACHQ